MAIPASASVSWNVVNESYGNGPGQVGFHATWGYDDNGFMVETLYDGYAELAPGLLGAYPTKTLIPGFPVGSDVTIEFRVRAVNGTGLATYWSETNDEATSGWNHVTYINPGIPNSVFDTVGGVNLSPAGFDGSAAHTYRFVRQGSQSLYYLFDSGNPLFLGELANSVGAGGAAGDGRNLMFGIPGEGEVYQFYYLRIATGAHIPIPPSVVPTPSAVLLGTLGLAVAGYRLRKCKTA